MDQRHTRTLPAAAYVTRKGHCFCCYRTRRRAILLPAPHAPLSALACTNKGIITRGLHSLVVTWPLCRYSKNIPNKDFAFGCNRILPSGFRYRTEIILLVGVMDGEQRANAPNHQLANIFLQNASYLP